MFKADLHVHSTISDSNYSVENILEMGKNIGLTHIAFTEHDTTDNVEYAIEKGKSYGIEVIPGIEISCYDKSINKKVHILGYNYSDNKNIENLCKPLLVRRKINCIRQIEILQDLGYKMDIDSIKKISGKYIYKQHILDYLCKTGQSQTIFGDIYTNIFKNGGQCDFDIEYIDPVDGIKAIVNDGGYAVLAHPGQQGNLSIIDKLINAGLRGIELNHHGNGESDKKKIRRICSERNLFITGGSDFHGEYEAYGSKLGSNLADESSMMIINKA